VEVTEQRLSAFRFLFVFFFVARIEQSKIRDGRSGLDAAPGFRCAQPGLRFAAPIVTKPAATAGKV
jgi:hypothetical protein